MTHRLFGAVAVVALASFAAATPGIAKSDSHKPSALIALQMAQQSRPALKLAMGPTSAPQKPGGTGEAPADTQPIKPPSTNISIREIRGGPIYFLLMTAARVRSRIPIRDAAHWRRFR